VKAYTRSGYDWASRFASIAEAAKRLPLIDAVIDGEVIATDDNGAPDFNILQSQLAAERSERLVYVAFDLLYLEGHDLRPAALEARKARLETILAKSKSARFLYSQHIVGGGPAVYAEACKMGAEGIVSKVRDAPYRSGRTDAWIKTLCRKRDTFTVVAFAPASSMPGAIGALYLGREEDGGLMYAGKAGTGYTGNTARALYKRLAPLIVSKSPLAKPVKKPKAKWVKPEMLIDVEYRAITPDGRLRHASFKGVREDLMQHKRR
jgi:bifunctional non-homologous end joining protein LigD